MGAAVLGFLGLGLAGLVAGKAGKANRWENNIVMTAGTSAARWP